MSIVYRRTCLSFTRLRPRPATFTSNSLTLLPKSAFYSPLTDIPRLPTTLAFSTSPPLLRAMNSATSSFTPDSSGTSPKQMNSIPNLKLNDGNEIPLLAYGVGTAQAFGADDVISGLTVTAVKNGYTHLDGAEYYGNETGLGKGIASCGIPRDQLFVTTKIEFREKRDVETALDASLSRLGLEYVDLYLIHHPDCVEKYEEDLPTIWRKMEAVKASGKARSIGVSNFLVKHLEEIVPAAKSLPVINQVEYHPYLQHTVDGILPYCREKGIALAAYAPLTPIVRASGGPLDGTLEKLGKKYGVTPSDILLRWCIDQGIVAVTTSSKEERMQGYRNRVPSFKLTPREVEEISKLGDEKHYRVFWNDKFAADDRR